MSSVPEGRATADYSRFFSVDVWCVGAAEESMMFDTLLPEVLTVIPLVKIEFNDVLIVALRREKDDYSDADCQYMQISIGPGFYCVITKIHICTKVKRNGIMNSQKLILSLK